MVASTYDAAMARVYADEGGFGIDRLDPGSATTYGITIIDARKYAAEFGWITGRQVTVDDMRVMPKWFAAKVYQKHYATPIRYDDLPAGFDYSVLDAGINSGIGRAIPWAGKALAPPIVTKLIDDVVKPANAANDKVSLIQRYWEMRLAFLHGLSTWSHFGPGWGRRCAQGEAAAVKMWLSIGAQMSPQDTRKRLDQEAGTAKTKSKTSAGKAAGSAAGTAAGSAGPGTIDISHLGLGGKIVLGIVIAGLIVAAVYFIRQSVIHNQRSAAYKAA